MRADSGSGANVVVYVIFSEFAFAHVHPPPKVLVALILIDATKYTRHPSLDSIPKVDVVFKESENPLLNELELPFPIAIEVVEFPFIPITAELFETI